MSAVRGPGACPDRGDRVFAGVLATLGMGYWTIAAITEKGPGMFFGVLGGSALFMMAARLLSPARGGAERGGEPEGEGLRGSGVGRWTKLSREGAEEVTVRWEPVIGHYMLAGEVWTDDEALSALLATMERHTTAPWVPASDEHTLAVRRGLGLPESREFGPGEVWT